MAVKTAGLCPGLSLLTVETANPSSVSSVNISSPPVFSGVFGRLCNSLSADSLSPPDALIRSLTNFSAMFRSGTDLFLLKKLSRALYFLSVINSEKRSSSLKSRSLRLGSALPSKRLSDSSTSIKLAFSPLSICLVARSKSSNLSGEPLFRRSKIADSQNFLLSAISSFNLSLSAVRKYRNPAKLCLSKNSDFIRSNSSTTVSLLWSSIRPYAKSRPNLSSNSRIRCFSAFSRAFSTLF
ncbi:hypothetical protein R80B4_01791 [Fibrobacteres bacterium R8-0-B4]